MVCSSARASGMRAHHLLCATCSRSRVLSTNRAPGNTERVNSRSSVRSSVGQSISLKPTRRVSAVGRSTVSSIRVRKPRSAVSSREPSSPHHGCSCGSGTTGASRSRCLAAVRWNWYRCWSRPPFSPRIITPGVMIRGENGGLLQHLYQFHRTAARHRDRLAPVVPLPQEHPWWGLDGSRDDTALRGFRTLMLETVLRPTADTRLVGFKEIDWPTDDLTELLEFTRSVFPGARFVLNTRDLEQVAQSKWWARIPDALAELQTIEKTFVEALAPLGDATYRVHYDDYVADPTVLRPLFEWLGLEFDEGRVRAVMDVRHSY